MTETHDRRRRLFLVASAVLASTLLIVSSGIVGWRVGTATTEVDDSAAALGIPESVPVVVFLGDSYSEGAGASSFGTRWTTLTSAAMEWSEINASAAGMGYTTSYQGQPTDYGTRLDVVAAVDPDIVVVSGGRNDLQSGSPQSVGTAATALYAGVRASAPEARIVVVAPLWDASAPPASFTELRDSVRQAAADADVEYVDIGQPLAGQPLLIGPDKLHPSDAGHRAIAQRIVSSLR